MKPRNPPHLFGSPRSPATLRPALRAGGADALSLMAREAARQGRPGEAIALLRRSLAEAPGDATARHHLAHLLQQQHRYDEALAELERLLARDAAHPRWRQMKASILESTGDAAQAAALHRALADEHPESPECWLNLGHALRAAGQRDEAIAAYRRAIGCRPGYGLAWWGLANLRSAVFADADLPAMQDQLARGDIDPVDRAALHYAIGQAHEDRRAYEPAFQAWQQGNALMRERIRYEPGTLTRAVAHQRAVFTPAFFAGHEGAGCPAPEPIFIVGRPRSGSTLVEQMLASHPAIEATAELPYIADLAAGLLPHRDIAFGTEYLNALQRLPATELSALGEAYLQRARRHRRLGRPFFIDKMPANFFHVGFIQAILPNAKIIDVRRQPVACGLSIFKSFSSKGSITLAELGCFHRDYLDLMAHFDDARPGRIHHVGYEALVDEPEAEIRRLLGHLGLPFDERCLRFHETQRTVLTPSSEQVRRPLFKDALDHWRHFEPWLAPLAGGLGPVSRR